jgi:hypothetical protein
VIFWPTKLPLMGWLKLKLRLVVLPANTIGARPGVGPTPNPDGVVTHVTPHVISKKSDGLVVDDPIILTTTKTLMDVGLTTVAVQL